MKTSKLTIGRLSLALALISVAIPFLIPILFKSTHDFFWIKGPYFIFGLEFLALILGIIAWRTLTGKIGTALSVGISLFLVAYLTTI
jgi:hypothetical protein